MNNHHADARNLHYATLKAMSTAYAMHNGKSSEKTTQPLKLAKNKIAFQIFLYFNRKMV